jgi:hypothetical protein
MDLLFKTLFVRPLKRSFKAHMIGSVRLSYTLMGCITNSLSSGVFSISSPLSYTDITRHRMGAKPRGWSPNTSSESWPASSMTDSDI